MGVAVVVSGLLGWLSLAVVARESGPMAYASFAVLWGVFYGFGGTLAGLQQEITRTAASAEPGATGRSVLAPSLAVGTMVAITAGITSMWWRVGDLTVGAVPVLAAGLICLTGLVTINGVLTVAARWGTLSALVVGDASIRLIAVIAAVAAEAEAAWLAVAIASGTLVWLPALLAPGIVPALNRPTGLTTLEFCRRSLPTMMGAACAGLLVAGYPMLVSLGSPTPISAEQGTLLAALVLFRTPLVMMLYGYRPVILRTMLASQRVWPVVRRSWVRCLGIGLVGVVGGGLMGPWLVHVLYGSEFDVSHVACVTILVSATLLMMLTVSSLGLVAADCQTRSTVGWLLALGFTLLVLLVPLGSEAISLLAGAVVGPAVGVVAHATSLRGA